MSSQFPQPAALMANLSEVVSAVGAPCLALDTSTPIASIALVTAADVDERLLFPPERSASRDPHAQAAGPAPMPPKPSEVVIATLASMLSDHDLRASDLGALCVGIGPGSFTGLRVGLATIKGLAFGAQVPTYAVSSQGLLAASYGPGTIAVANDARRGEVFCAIYTVDEGGELGTVLADDVMEPERFARSVQKQAVTRIVGGFAAAVNTLAGDACEVESQPWPRAACALVHARSRLRAGEADNISELVPRYLRVSEAERQLQA